MISGNTLSGVYGEANTRYAQRNHSSGMSVVHSEGSPIKLVPWFIKDSGFYCEDWDKDGVLCYQLSQNTDNGERYFVYPDGSKSSAVKVQEGYHSITFE